MSIATSRPRITIERLRTFVLIGGILLVLLIAAVLIGGRWVRRYVEKDIPGRLGFNIVQQADGVDISQARKGRTIYKIHASRAIKKKSDGSAVLQDVRIELFGEDGSHTDTISGKEFEYNPREGIATAAGQVEITMMRPGEKPAVAQMPMPGLKSKAGSKTSAGATRKPDAAHTPTGSPPSSNPELRGLTQAITDGQIHVTTSGLVFHQKEGIATTTQQVNFALKQGRGSANGATYNSQNGSLVLDRDVQIHVERSGTASQAPVNIYAAHAEFDHDAMTCMLTNAKADYSGERAQSGSALLHLRDDGSIAKLDGSNGVSLDTDKGSQIEAPKGWLDFDEENQPTQALLLGGTKFALTQPDRTVEGTSPMAHLVFDKEGQLSQAHLEEGVEFHSRQQSISIKNSQVVVNRSWRSQVADISFAPETPRASKQLPSGQSKSGESSAHVEARTVRGSGGVTVTSETTTGGMTLPSRLSADSLTAQLGPGEALSTLSASGRVSFDERGAKGDRNIGSSDQLEAHFFPADRGSIKGDGRLASSGFNSSQLASVVQTGHVVLTQEAAVRDGKNPGLDSVRAVAEKSEYNGTSQMVYLSGSPRIRDGGMDISADRINLSRATGDGHARGDVRISWLSSGASGIGTSGLFGNENGSGASSEPLNAVADEADLHKSVQEVILRGGNSGSGALRGDVRLWQGINSVAAPLINLNRQQQTLDAQADGSAHPVKTVMMESFGNTLGTGHGTNKGVADRGAKSADSSSLIRIRSGSLHYSEGEHLAVFQHGVLPGVVAQTVESNGVSTISAQRVDVVLTPRSTAKGKTEQESGSRQPQHSIDHLVALGKVTIDWPGRHGAGEQLVYRGEDGTFTLTGSESIPPRITDEIRGSISGKALVYHSRDASVTVEGDGDKTVTDTRSKK